MKKTDKEYYIKYVTDCWQQAEDAMEPVFKQWRELWQLYQNKQDYSKKAGWQSKCFVPKIMMQVEKAAGEVKRAVLQTRKLFKFELNDEAEQEQIQKMTEMQSQTQDPNILGNLQAQIKLVRRKIDVRRSRMQMRERQFKQRLALTKMGDVYSEMIKSAFLTGLGIPKVIWSDDDVNFENVDAMNIRISPDYVPYSRERPLYLIERQEMSLAELRQRVKRANENDKIYDKAEVKKIEDDMAKIDTKTQRRQRLGLGDYQTHKKKVELKVFWGDIIDEKDEKIEENMLLVVANDKYLIRCHENPFSHRKDPYIPTMPLVYPHRGTHGISLVAPQVKLQYTVNNIVNMFLDNLNFSITKMYEYNPNDLQNPLAMTAIYPGKTVEVNTTGGQQAIREIVTSAVKRDVLYMYELIDREMQEGTGITEYISGLPGKKSKTLGEVEQKMSQSRGLFDTIGRDIERNSLKPLLEMAYDLYSQFLGWEPREGNYIFVVSGLTVMLQQKELVERVSQILSMSLSSPLLAQMTEIPDLWKKLLGIYNLSDAYKEPIGMTQMGPEQKQAIMAKAEQDAKRDVAQGNIKGAA